MFWNISSCPRMFQSIQGINNRGLFDDVDFTYNIHPFLKKLLFLSCCSKPQPIVG